MSARKALLQFAKTPLLGQVKTRLCPPLTAQQALDAHVQLLRDTCRLLCQLPDASLALWTDQQVDHPVFQQCLRMGVRRVYKQRGRDLGQRMFNALDSHLLSADAVVLVGSDCPGFSLAYLQHAFEQLDHHDVVIGPAFDGGYVLIGARRVVPALFAGISWGGDQVLAATRQRLRDVAFSYAELSPLGDVDDYADWLQWQAMRR